MSNNHVGLQTSIDDTKLMIPIRQLISRRKTTAVEVLGTSFSTSAERLLSEQSVYLLGEANSQIRKE